jgi:hypothetical protein
MTEDYGKSPAQLEAERWAAAEKLIRAASIAGDLGGIRAAIAEFQAIAPDNLLVTICPKGLRPWHLAAKHNQVQALKYFHELGIPVHSGISEVLDTAAQYGATECVRYLLENGASLDVFNGERPLQYASQNGHAEVVRLLLEKTAPEEMMKGYRYRYWDKFIFSAAAGGHGEVVKLLLPIAWCINSLAASAGSNALGRAITRRHERALKTLLDAEVKPEAHHLVQALNSDVENIVKILLNANTFWSPSFLLAELDGAIKRDSQNSVKALLEYGAEFKRKAYMSWLVSENMQELLKKYGATIVEIRPSNA